MKKVCVLGVVLCLLLVFQVSESFAQKVGTGESEVSILRGLVTMTTSEDGMWTFVTLPPKRAGKPLEAAFVLQHMPEGVSSSFVFKGEAQITFTGDSLWVKPENERGWIFKIDRYGSEIREGFTSVDVVGIARYWWKFYAWRFPRSHGEFVKDQLSVMKGERDWVSTSLRNSTKD